MNRFVHGRRGNQRSLMSHGSAIVIVFFLVSVSWFLYLGAIRSPNNTQSDGLIVREGSPSSLLGNSNENRMDTATIFVSIASFRDIECAPTIADLFHSAKHPERISVGVVDQRDDQSRDAKCVPKLAELREVPDAPSPLNFFRRWKRPCLDDAAAAKAEEEAGQQVLHSHSSYSASSRSQATDDEEREKKQPSATIAAAFANLGEEAAAFGAPAPFHFCPLNHIRVTTLHPSEAKGPTYARYLASLLYKGEDYVMMIDSHNRFVPQWDLRMLQGHQTLLEQRRRDLVSSSPADGEAQRSSARLSGIDAPPASWTEADREAAAHRFVFSHYPAAYSPGIALTGHDPYPRMMCNGHFLPNGIFRLDGMPIKRRDHALRQPFIAAGLIFGNASYLQDVLMDPHLDFLFDGEEVLYASRLYTNGWDSYLPTENLLYHFYTRKDAPKVWSVAGNKWWVHQGVSNERALKLLLNFQHEPLVPIAEDAKGLALQPFTTLPNHRPVEPSGDARVMKEWDKYGMGTRRSLRAFWAYAMVDPVEKSTRLGICDFLVKKQLGEH